MFFRKPKGNGAMPQVKLRRLPHGEGLDLPSRSTAGAAGFDLRSADAFAIAPGQTIKVRTGFEIELPAGYEGQVRSRHGMSFNHGIVVLNQPATIDCDYRGELLFIVKHLGNSLYTVKRGDRIAQLVVKEVPPVEIIEVTAPLSPTERGTGGLGHTGVA